MLIHLKYRYTILGKIFFSPDASDFRFSVPLEGSSPVIVELIPSGNEVEASHTVEVSEEMSNFLQNGILEVPSTLYDELRMITINPSLATKRVLNLVKYGLNCINLDERLISHKSAEWSIDKAEWKILPSKITATLDSYGIHPLNTNTVSAIQQCIQNGFEPFLALRHLHKARIENIPHYKWIDATIAAELAIKEFLIRLKPEIATLLLEMPSPPLHKLYGTVLESFGMQRSPKIKQIARGVEIRNKLVHKPEEMKITPEEANTYVRDMEIAIYHLLISLYPNDPNVKYFYYTVTLEDALSS